MENFGYITLNRASELSGIKSDTLKKRCQDGKISGAIKRGKVWLIPKREIIKLPESLDNDLLLEFLVRIADSETAGLGITLLISGKLLSGQLISAKKYYSLTKDSIKKHSTDTRLSNFLDKALFDPFEKALPKGFSEVMKSPVLFLHLADPIIMEDGRSRKIEGTTLRLRMDSVQGFFFGEITIEN